MPEPRRIPLNPSDYFFYSHHRMMQRRSEGGNIAFMMMDIDGHIDPDRMRSILRSLFLAHPVLMARLKISLLSGRPYWRLPDERDDAAGIASKEAYVFEDLRAADNARGCMTSLCQQRYLPGWNLTSGPQIRLEHYALPGKKSVFCLRWPHPLMDAGGTMWLLAELARIGEGDANATPNNALLSPDGPRPDHACIDPLAGFSMMKKFSLFLESFSTQRRHGKFNVNTLFENKPPPFRDQRFIHRHWDAESFQRVREHAKRSTPPGPGIYARYLAASVFRALHRIFSDRGVDTDAYMITMPMNIADLVASGSAPVPRPIPGNYLVSPTLWARRDIVEDKTALAEDIFRQFNTYLETQSPLKQWAMIWAASFARASVYQWLMRLPLGLEALSSGYSYYGEISRPLRDFCGAKVSNLWGASPLPTPPGWNPAFSKFGDQINLSLTYARPAIDDELARRYVDLIEEEAFDGTE